MAKNIHTFAKKQREMEKKRKTEEKLAKRRKKKEDPEAIGDAPAEAESQGGDEATSDSQ